MSTLNTVGNLVAELGDRLGTPLSLDENGICELQYGDDERDVIIEVPDGEDEFLIYAPVSDAPDHNEEPFYKRILGMNFLGQETGGCCLGIDENDDQIVLAFRQQVSDLAASDFENLVRSFIDTLEVVRSKLQEVETDPDLPPESDSTDMNPGLRV